MLPAIFIKLLIFFPVYYSREHLSESHHVLGQVAASDYCGNSDYYHEKPETFPSCKLFPENGNSYDYGSGWFQRAEYGCRGGAYVLHCKRGTYKRDGGRHHGQPEYVSPQIPLSAVRQYQFFACGKPCHEYRNAEKQYVKSNFQ